MPYKPNPEARGVSRKTDREGFVMFAFGRGQSLVFGMPWCSGIRCDTEAALATVSRS